MKALQTITFLGVMAIILESTAYAGSTNLSSDGGAGGGFFSLDCGDDKVLIGIEGKKGGSIDSIRAVCAKVLRIVPISVGTYEHAKTQSKGGPAGNSFSAMCPPGKAVKAMKVGYGWWVDQITLKCDIPPTDGGPVAAGLVAGSDPSRVAGSSTPPNQGPFRECDRIGRGLHGKSALMVDSLGLICHTSPTPTFKVVKIPDPISGYPVNLLSEQGPSTLNPTPYVQFVVQDAGDVSQYRIKFNQTTQLAPFTAVNIGGAAVRVQTYRNTGPAYAGPAEVQALMPNGFWISQSRPSLVRFTSGNPGVQEQPVITSIPRVGAATVRINWSYTGTAIRFKIYNKVVTGTSWTLASTTADGNARQDTIGPVLVDTNYHSKVCAVVTPSQEVCSNPFSYTIQ